MKPSRRFRPDATILEGRVVLSRVAVHPSMPAGAPAFPLDADQSTAAGIPVYMVYTIVKQGAGVETQAVLTEHVAGSDTWTYHTTTTLPNRQGVGKTVEVVTETSPGTYDHEWTIDEPDGSVVHEQRRDLVAGNTTYYLALDGLDGGGSEVGTGRTVRRGATSTTDKTYMNTNGLAHTYHSVVVDRGALGQVETDTTTWSDGKVQVVHSTRTGIRLPPTTS